MLKRFPGVCNPGKPQKVTRKFLAKSSSCAEGSQRDGIELRIHVVPISAADRPQSFPEGEHFQQPYRLLFTFWSFKRVIGLAFRCETIVILPLKVDISFLFLPAVVKSQRKQSVGELPSKSRVM